MPPLSIQLLIALFGGICAWAGAAFIFGAIFEYYQKSFFQVRIFWFGIMLLILFIISLFFGDYQALHQIIKAITRFPIYA